MYNKLSDEELKNALTPYEPPGTFVYYDEFGNVTAISNITTLGGNYIQIPQYRADEFLSKGKDFNKYKIDYFKTDAPIKEDKEHMVYHLLYMIPELKTHSDRELIVIHDSQRKSWTFSLNNLGKKKVSLENKDKRYLFYVTKNRNPHFLFSTIEILGADLIQGKEIKFNIQDEHDLTKISIFTSPNFESYGIVKNDTQV